MAYPYRPPGAPGGGYPPAGGGYPPQGGYPPAGGGYPPAGGGYPPQGGYPSGYPSPAGSQYGGYPPQGGGYPPQGGFPQATSFHGTPIAAPPPKFQGWFTWYYQQLSPKELQDLQGWFRSVDRDNSGSISIQELMSLSFGGKPLGFEAAKKLLQTFDRDKSLTIDFYEYAALHKFLTSMQGAFFEADQNRSGTLDANEIHGALTKGGFQLSFTALNGFFLKYSQGRGQVDFQTFVHLVATLALVRSKFEWADTDRDGRITLDLNQTYEFAADLF